MRALWGQTWGICKKNKENKEWGQFCLPWAARHRGLERGSFSTCLQVADVTETCMFTRVVEVKAEYLLKSLWSCFLMMQWQCVWNEKTVDGHGAVELCPFVLARLLGVWAKAALSQPGAPGGPGKSGHPLLWTSSKREATLMETFFLIRKIRKI